MDEDLKGFIFFSMSILILFIIYNAAKFAKTCSVKPGQNKYGVKLENGHYELYKSQSKIMIITGAVLIVLIIICFFGVCNKRAEYKYEIYNDFPYSVRFDEDYIEGAQEWSKDDWYDYYIENYANGVKIAVVLFFLYGCLYPIYMYPVKVARRKEHEQTIAITFISSLFGCTIIIFIIMLIWANNANPKVTYQNNNNDVDQLVKLKKLYDEGVITQEEFESSKKNILNI